ncbi:MAG TPA: tryptophan synthase subunit alpha [Bacteroidetes bacterium]|nr:tryptophan synthase subunit alpha [Bacteroidota bacterium]
MNNRINNLFHTKNGPVLSVYFTAGFPGRDDTVPLVEHLSEAGADMIELGFPFSDPLADGPVIQNSSRLAIRNGMSLPLLFRQIKHIRKHTDIPLLLMGYLNPVMQYGEDRFLEKCAETGIDGVILPDMSLEYFREHFRDRFCKLGLSNILLITPATPPHRIRQIDALSDGFIYMVSSDAITGGSPDLSRQQEYYRRVASMNLKNPTLTGFGIHDRDSFLNACRYSRGAIVGSAFIKHLEAAGVSRESVRKFMGSILP